jgi:transposase
MLAVRFPGFRVTGVDSADSRIRIDISVDSNSAKCPDCGGTSTSVHSSYLRRLRDLPILGNPVEVTASARWFRCRASGCSRVTFVESLYWPARRHAQRTQRGAVVLRSLVSLLSSTLRAALAFSLGIRTGSSTLLRTVDRSLL